MIAVAVRTALDRHRVAELLQETQRQSEELEQTNTQLEEQAQLLESQKDELTRSRAGMAAKADELERTSPGRVIELTARGGLDGRWDGARLAQVLSNLLGNALKHGDGGSVQVELDGTRHGEVGVRMRNEGSIPAEMLPHLFDLHSLIARKRARGDGLGLGLYIVRQLVEAHGGTVTVSNAPDGREIGRAHV